MTHRPPPNIHQTLGFCLFSLLRRHRSLLHPERRGAAANGRTGLRNSSSLRSCTGRGQIKFLGSAFARLLKIFTMACLPPNSVASRANRLRRLQQRQFIVVNPPAMAEYVFYDLICSLTIYPEFLVMLFILTRILHLCMLVPVFIVIYSYRI
jgi:hypothetical protein